MPVWHITRNIISIRRSLRPWSRNSCLPFLVPSGTAKVSDTPGGRWVQIKSLCSTTELCRHLDGGSITSSLEAIKLLLQLRVLSRGFLEDGNVRVSIFPNCQEPLISSAGPGGIVLQR